MTSSLDGRTAIVTGGSTLVGHGVVRALHEAGARVLVADIDTEGGAQIADALGEGVLFRRTDITDDADLAGLVADTVAGTVVLPG